MPLRYFCLLLMTMLALAACGQNQQPDSPDHEVKDPGSHEQTSSGALPANPEPVATNQVDGRWLPHLAEYPGGQVSARAPLVVHFTHPVVDEARVGKEAGGAVRLTPELPVQARFASRDTLVVRPDKPFAAGQKLTLTLYPQALDGIGDDLPPLVDHLQVMEQSFRVRVDALAPAGDREMILSGRVDTRDVADPDAVARTVTASQGDHPLEIVWQHDDAGHEHRFTVVHVRRGGGASPVTVAWDGEPLGVSSKGSHQYPVPASADAFVVTTVRTVSHPKPHVRIQFSQPLLGDQDLTGMVTLDDEPATVRIDGSALDVYPDEEPDDQGRMSLEVHPGVRSAKRIRLNDALKQSVTLVVTRPGVRFVGEGSILPHGDTLSVPIEAVGARAVKVQAFEIYENNIPGYLQNHALNGSSSDRAVGRWLWQKTLSLPPDMGEGWQRYQLDLTELMAQHPKGLVLLKLRLDAETSTYQCPGESPTLEARLPDNYEGPGQNEDYDVSDYYQDAGYLKWSERDDPCANAYYAYNDRVAAARAFLASNLGLIAKQGENNKLMVFGSWLDSNTPASRVRIRVYNYQNQRLGTATTNTNGEAAISVTGTPFYLVAEKGDQKGYLKLARNLALPTNQFDTGGKKVTAGLKGFFYGERDVWRPGDDIYLTFVLNDPDQRLPDDYPITLDWINPRGDKVTTYTSSDPTGGFYTFTLTTNEDAPTGNWRAVARVGKRTFATRLRVEAIKPNHLKIDITAPDRLQAGIDNAITLQSQWLNGASASGLQADVKVRLASRKAEFEGYDGFDFNDPTRKLGAKPFNAFEGKLDADGQADFDLGIPDIEPAGMASAVLTTRVFENSGDYSTQIRSLPVMPYQHWTGLHIPEGNGWGGALARDKDTPIGLLTLNSEGQPEAGRDLTLSVYHISWHWWWDKGSDDLVNFINDPDTRRETEVALTTDDNGRAQWTLHGSDYDWGRYLIRVCQDQGRQCAARTLYLGWGGERGAGGDAATRLALSTDEDRYKVGDTAHVQVPAAGGGRLLVSLETGRRVLQHYWVSVPKDQHKVTLNIPVTSAMAPNAYVDVMLLQAHAERDNDRPIRLYGIAPLLVEDPKTRLHPHIVAPQQVRPEGILDVTVSEKDGRPMTYTLAVVDEGLLGLTNFHTPYIHDAFYQREALGVRTWDLYDQVVGAYGGDLAHLLAVGGSDALTNGREKQSRRFPPVALFLGPFQLHKGQAREHAVELPAYMGQVRIMVVAGDGDAYGAADEDVTVTQPLTLLSTLPRVLGPAERLDLPVTVFAAPDQRGKVPADVDVSAHAQAPIEVVAGKARLHFEEAGNKIAMLALQVGDGTGTAAVTVHARAGDARTKEVVHLPVRAPNPAITKQQVRSLNKGGSWDPIVRPHGVVGTNQAWLTVSRLPDMGLQKRLQYLIHYPHGCIEQTTSAVFPQLYLSRLINLDDADKQRIQSNITAAIDRYGRFQLADGGFSYWPGGSKANDWGTNYAGHFLLEAKRAGYAVPSHMLDRWQAYQKRRATSLGSHPWNWSIQAYRLYTLALAGAPEVGAMNRLRELLLNEAERQGDNPDANYLNARWLLADSYQRLGLNETAGELVPDQVAASYHAHWYHTFGSRLRDQAIAMQVRSKRGDDQGAWELARAIADKLASSHWYSTQTLAWALMGMAEIGGSDSRDKGFAFRWRRGEQDWQPIHSEAAVYRQELEQPDQDHSLQVRNDSDSRLFVAVTTRGTPPPGAETAADNGLSLQVHFENASGERVDPAELLQGTDFVAHVTITNHSSEGLRHVALTQIMPSGWQITESPRDGSKQQAPLDYRDLRDDRVMTYFQLPAGKSRRYTVRLNASFAGRFYLPAWQARAMYKGHISGRTSGEWVQVRHD